MDNSKNKFVFYGKSVLFGVTHIPNIIITTAIIVYLIFNAKPE